jgi:hypothetical protein
MPDFTAFPVTETVKVLCISIHTPEAMQVRELELYSSLPYSDTNLTPELFPHHLYPSFLFPSFNQRKNVNLERRKEEMGIVSIHSNTRYA